MLEIRNVTKIYKSKSGNSVTALDNLSMTFPETGMVFILGKSGSGKSTLLNVIGGLDGYDSGEFVIKGKSSKDFAGSDFDAYRNTFIGFIFQEYNILDDFSVGANIGLALELQGKKATSEQISNILAQVDMLDYAKRKPNELSGGQKQRIAIARALVKDPEIIMADEPTGALDSNTGKQIFDTLKALSKTKLVIVVSHDRDFAEKYGDRIVEMKDGKILSDVTKHEVEAQVISSGILKMNDNLLRIEKGYQLTAQDVMLINEYLRNQPSEILISGDTRLNNNVRASAGISDANTSSVFDETDAKRDIPLKDYSGTKTKFIRSRLPMKNALKMGSSSLGHKKFRLVMTIFLSLIAFALFGFADSLGAYDKVVAATDSILDSNVQNASYSVSVKHTYVSADGKDSESYFYGASMNEDDLNNISEQTGIQFIPVFNGSDYGESTISLFSMMQETDKISSSSAYAGCLYGLTPADESELASLSFPITGTMPKKDNEIAITEFLYRELNLTGFRNDAHDESVKAGELTTATDGSQNSIIGKHLTFNLHGWEHTFTITAVIDTGFDYARYEKYVPTENEDQGSLGGGETDGNQIVDYLMLKELQNTLYYGFHGLGYVTQSKVESMAKTMMGMRDPTESLGTYMNWNLELVSKDQQYATYIGRVADSSALSALPNLTWFDGKSHEKLGENEIVIPRSALFSVRMEENILNKWNDVMAELYGSDWESYVEDRYSLTGSVESVALHAYVNDDNHFNAIRNDLVEAYELHNGKSEQVSDESLRSFWLDALRWNPHMLPDGAKTAEDICHDAFQTVLEKLLGLTFDAKLTPRFYREALNSLGYSPDEDFLNVSVDSLQQILAREYAYLAVYGNPDFYTSEEFFNAVIANRGIKEEDWNEYQDKEADAAEFYYYYIWERNIDNPNVLGGKTYSDFAGDANVKFLTVSGKTMQDYLNNLEFRITDWFNDGAQTVKEYKIVGTYDSLYSNLVVSDTLYAEYEEYRKENNMSTEIIAPHEPGIYAFAIAPMPTDANAIRKLVEINYDESGDVQFNLQNQVMNTLSGFNDFIEIGAKVFLYIGLGFALFSALMLMNFISISISYKRREIGILRAVGARSSDVFKIFFCEAFIIALINCILSIAAAATATTVFNTIVRNQGINVTLLHFGFRQVILMLFISVLVAAVASFLPVWNIARRKPIDAIKNK